MIVDLSAPRRFAQNKIDEAIFELKFNPPKVDKKKVLIIAGVVLVLTLTVGGTVLAADINTKEAQYLINYYTNNLHWPLDKVLDTLRRTKESEIIDLYNKRIAYDQAVNDLQWKLNVVKKTGHVGEKVIHVFVEGLQYQLFMHK